MAFQQPARQPVQRVARPSTAVESTPEPPAALQDREPDQSQTSWVLFSPPTEVTTASYLSETERSVDTPCRSRGLASLHTAPRSSQTDDFRLSLASSAVDDVSVDEDAELDSLDSHLPEFRSQPGDHVASHRNSFHGAAPVFPAHDGLGSFRLDRPALGRDAQEQIYQFERFNPKRLRVDTADDTYMEMDAAAEAQETAKRERIEAWRLEHSRVLLDEVQRETRRRRKSLVSMHRRHQSQTSDDNMTWHDDDDDTTEAPNEDRGFLARITRTVVKDIFGIDERLLGILLGEAVVDEDDLSNTPRASQLNTAQSSSLDEESWQLRILESVSRELGRLVNHLSPHHPGAFSTYSRMQQMPLPYAGLPVIPEAADLTSIDHPSAAPPAPEFKPSLTRNTQPIPIPGKGTDETEDSGLFSKDEWERDLDIKLVFRYLISRFTSRNNSSASGSSSHLATTSMQDAAARVARVRQHHPLIARARPMERRPFRAIAPSSPIAARPRSSCASQSTRRSARRSSTSSRHYWDIGGSLGTGSMIGPQGPMGSWGEA
ncbi:hypothetical protein ISF_04205 [Cordyceps fumosorosea ARSEF 2679]|uniref:Uncharacterized protein n=1 Tax=Cordyceps fumosorosea (strain ARSEF 2679) TaxID=1081104 RepID=A0A167XCA1_CORFA|nr:hypothetical protein ISF_04205 [Cordyceps fumosorosea ARSEF 2679]OAA64795.1 hypothetical protein ISF_04205 [Cordyceps fumosorosea ARSEF 2679]